MAAPGRASQWLDYFRTLLFIMFLLRWVRKGFYQLKGRGVIGTLQMAYAASLRELYGIMLSLPPFQKKIQEKLDQTTAMLEETMLNRDSNTSRFLALPASGLDKEQILQEVDQFAKIGDVDWEHGKVSGAIYHGGKELSDLQTDAYRRFSTSNPLHPDVWPGLRAMDAQVVSMVINMYNGGPEAAGTTTSGGTESILLACLAARNRARIESSITEPEMIVPVTVHAAFDKAANYFGIKIHHVEVHPTTYKVNIKRMKRLINPNTVLLVGSAPNFPHGIMDDITALSRLALRHGIPLHVDACLGSFLVPFLEKAGYPTEPFDFRLAGVTSISCDTHKYGFAPKGSSVIMYRTKKLRSYQYFVQPNWSGGVYASPTIAGSRPGALIAGAWASMMKFGEDGYTESCHAIVGAAKRIEDGIRHGIPELFVIGKPLVSVVAFGSSVINIYELSDEMTKLGWHLNALQSPPAIHIAATFLTVNAVDSLLSDLRETAQTIHRRGAGPVEDGGSSTVLYGVAGSLPNKSVVSSIAELFLDTMYKA